MTTEREWIRAALCSVGKAALNFGTERQDDVVKELDELGEFKLGVSAGDDSMQCILILTRKSEGA